MARPENTGADSIGRREALALGVAGAGIGIASMLGGSLARAQRPRAFPPPRDPNFGESPSWTTELREIGPNCYTWVQGNGPPHNGGTVVELLPIEPAHTWGDILVHLPEHKTLWMGDNGFFHMAPFLHNGYPTGWMMLLESILDMDLEIIVPGHGPAAGKAEVQEMLDYMALLRDEARLRFDAGTSAGTAAAEIRMGKFDNWMGAERIILNLFRWYEEFGGEMEHHIDLPRFREATAEYNTIVGGTPQAHRRIYRHHLHHS